MIKIIGIDQTTNFATKEVKSFLLIEVGGDVIRAEVSLADAVLVAQAALVAEPTEKAAEAAVTSAAPHKDLVAPAPVAPPREEKSEVVEWEMLPENLLNASFKAAFRMMDVPPVLPVERLVHLVETIDKEFTEEDWQEVYAFVGGADDEPEQEEPKAVHITPPTSPTAGLAPAAQAGPVVAWSNGMVLKNTRPARTVQADENGYPIVSDAGVSPQRIIARGQVTDDYGVGQV